MKKRIQVQSRISEEENNQLKKLCEKYNITNSEFIRSTIKYFIHSDRENRIFNKDKKFKKELLFELHRYGNNLNQIAYDLNSILLKNQLSISKELINSTIDKIAKIDDKINSMALLISERI